MVSGDIGLPSKPQIFNGEQLVFKERTSDPSSTEKGEAWLRTDLAPDANQLATLRFDNGSGTWDIPIFQTGTSGADVEEILRIPVGGVVGYIPVTDNNPAFSQLGFQHNSTQYALHNAVDVSDIPASAVHRWILDESTGPFVDSVGTADGTNNGTSRVTGTYVDGAAREGDGTADEITTSTWGSFGSSMDTDFAIAFTIDGHNGGAGGVLGTRNSNLRFRLFVSSAAAAADSGSIRLDLSDANGSALRIATDGGHVDDGGKHRVVVNKVANAGGGAIEFYDNTTELTNTTTESDDGFGTVENFNNPVTLFAHNNQGTREAFLAGILDDVIIFNDSLTAQQVTDDYNRQPWSP